MLISTNFDTHLYFFPEFYDTLFNIKTKEHEWNDEWNSGVDWATGESHPQSLHHSMP